MRPPLALFLTFVIAVSLAPLAQGQTLGEVLRAVQKRKQLLEERKNIEIMLENDTGYNSPSPLLEVQLIDWGGVSEFPPDTAVGQLPMDQQAGLARQAWLELDRMVGQFIDVRRASSGAGKLSAPVFEPATGSIAVENLPDVLRLLERRISSLKMVQWPLLSLGRGTKTSKHSGSGGLPSPPLQWDGGTITDSGGGESLHVRHYGHGFAIMEFISNAINPELDWSLSITFDTALRTRGSGHFSGSITLYAGQHSRDYDVNSVNGLSWPSSTGGGEPVMTPYHPGRQRIMNLPVPDDSPHDLGALPGIFGGDASGVELNGSWSEWGDLGPIFPGQTSELLFLDYSPGRDYQNWFPFESYLTLDFGDEFTTPTPPPQEAPPLVLTPDFAHRRLTVPLTSDPTNPCMLVWNLSPGVAERNKLDVIGCGDWDAVFSGHPDHREPEMTWSGGLYEPNERWERFDDYLEAWWQPVLTQVKTATYGINIIQQGRHKYRLDFYRKDQVGAKSATTGLYAFTGSPVESFTVENPSPGDTQAGSMRITTSRAVYELGSANPDSSWTLTGKDSQTDGVFLTRNAEVSPAAWTLQNSVGAFTQPYTVTETTSIDGQSLPEVTTTYWDTWANPLRIDKIVEDAGGNEGTRTTTFTYVWADVPLPPPSTDAVRLPQHLSTIVQTGGLNPSSATFNTNNQLTAYTRGPLQVGVVYDGASVTHTEKFNNTTVHSTTTTYEGLAAATTETANVNGSVPALIQRYPASDETHPWGLKLLRGSDGSLTTFSYTWNAGDFVTTVESGRGANSNALTVAAGTRTVTRVNAAGKGTSAEVYDIESGAKLDFATATGYQAGTPFPSAFSRPLGTTEQFSYDLQGRVLSHTDRLGKSASYTLDALGRVTQIERASLTWTIAHNPGYLGRSITCDGRTQTEQSTPFGSSQSLTVSGPEQIEITRSESATAITTNVVNSTTQRTLQETTQKSNLATSVSGNATEPWNTSYSFPGNGWKQTVTHDSASALSTEVTFDALGRPIQTRSPSGSGSGQAITNYSYSGGLLASAIDPAGTTTYTYQPDGSMQQISRGGRFMAVNRTVSNAAQIGWEWTDATGEVLWRRIYLPQSGMTEDYPRGKPTRKLTTTPSIAEDVMTLTRSGPGWNQQNQWKDGAPHQGSISHAAATADWSAQANAFGELTSHTLNTGGQAGNSLTTHYSPLGLPEGLSGLVTADVNHAFTQNGSTHTVTRNGHSQTLNVSSKGDLMANTGHRIPDEQWSAPNYGTSISRTLSTGAGNAPFTWNAAGLLTERKFPDGSGETFSYNSTGAPTAWSTPRATFQFSPNAFGQPTQIGYDATLGYDAAGRLNAVSDAAGARTRTYVDGQLDVESHSSGVLVGQAVNRDYDALGRLSKLSLPGAVDMHYSYHPTHGALTGVTTAAGASGTWSQLDPVTGKATSFSIGPLSRSRTFDALGHVTGHANTASGATTSHGYGYNAEGRCVSVTGSGGSWTLGYNAHGYLGSASGWKNFSYSFDEAGRPPSSIDYRPLVRFNSGQVAVAGSVAPGATVTVNGQPAAVDGAGRFSHTDTAVPGAWQEYLVRGTLAGAGHNGSNAVADKLLEVFAPPLQESLSYDVGGNRIADARWSLGWNSLDQLTSVTETAPRTPVLATQIHYVYDAQGRRVQKSVSKGGQLTQRTTTLWDAWLPVMETDFNGSGQQTARRYYTWGPDISGTLGGAGGIGGLVEILETKAGLSTRSLPLYDGLGNVVGLVDGVSGARVATYQHGPFGEVVSVSGERAGTCPFRFQTKLYDDEVGYYYFGKRYYDPKTQTWLSRDPLREGGGVNLYAYCGGDPVNNYDYLGMLTESQRQRFELANSIFRQIIEKNDSGGWNGFQPSDILGDELKTSNFGLTNPGLRIPLYFFSIPLDAKAQLRARYPAGESDADIALVEATSRNRVRAQMLLAEKGLLRDNDLNKLRLSGLGVLAEGTLDVALTLAPFGSVSSLAKLPALTTRVGGSTTVLPRIGLAADSQTYLFRGTTPGFPGRYGVSPTSTSPGVATHYGVEAATSQVSDGVVYVIPRSAVKGKILPPQLNALPKDFEVPLDIHPLEIPNFSVRAVPVSDARTILESIGYSVPRRLDSYNTLNQSINLAPTMSPAQIQAFLKALGL